MKIRRVCVDLDGVLADFITPVLAEIRKHYPQVDENYVNDTFKLNVDIEKKFGIPSKEIWKIIGKLMGQTAFWHNLAPIQENIVVIQELLNSPYIELCYLTSRPMGSMIGTNSWLTGKKLMRSHTSLIMVEHKVVKGTVAHAIGACALVDDSVEVMNTLYDLDAPDYTVKKPQVAGFLYTTPWNVKATIIPESGITRINKLEEFKDYVLEGI